MANRQKDAFEQLREQVKSAQAAALQNPLWGYDLDKLGELVEGHKLGENFNGWTNPYPKDDPRSLLLEYQFADFHDDSRFKATLQARQTGKDFTGQGEIVQDCVTNPGTEWMVAAPSERQALDSLDQGKLWAEAFGLVIDDYRETREGHHSQTLLKSAEIIWSNKSKSRAVPGKPDTVRGRSSNIYLTEFDFFEHPQATWRALLPSITNPLRGGEKKVRIKTTPNGAGGAMHRIWTKEDRLMTWARHLVTIYHAVLMGLPVDVAAIREALDDAEGFDQEFLCKFLDSAAILLPYELIALAESAEASEVWEMGEASQSNPTYLGIDFGRSNDPTVCWTLQRQGDVKWTREVLVLENVSSPDQEAILKDRVRAARRVCFDYTGPGIGLGDYLVKNHGGRWRPDAHEFGKIELCTFTTQFKRLLFPRLRKEFQAPTKLRIPISITIREDLHQMQQVLSNGEYNYWSPRTKAGHSDRCTALALAVRAADADSGPIFAQAVSPKRRTHRKLTF